LEQESAMLIYSVRPYLFIGQKIASIFACSPQCPQPTPRRVRLYETGKTEPWIAEMVLLPRRGPSGQLFLSNFGARRSRAFVLEDLGFSGFTLSSRRRA
jgi:hypothetical protein